MGYINMEITDTQTNSISEILGASGLNVWQIDCTADSCRMTAHSERAVAQTFRSISYTKLRQRFLEKFISEQSRADIAAKTDISYMRQMFENGEKQISIDMRRDGNKGRIKAVILPSGFCDGRLSTVIMIFKAVNDSESGFISKSQLSRRFNTAIQNTYSAIVDINYTYDTYTITSYAKQVNYPFADTGRYSQLIENAADSIIHPDDRAAFCENLLPDRVKTDFAQTGYSYGEYRILNTNGAYRWYSVRVVKIESAVKNSVTAMAFFRDINSWKMKALAQENETKRHNLALRDSYENVLELNITTGKIKVIHSINPEYKIKGERYDYDFVYKYITENLIQSRGDGAAQKLESGYLKRAFESENRESVYMECKFRNDKNSDFHWVSIRIVRVPSSTSYTKVMFLMRNVEDRKSEEIKTKRRQEQYDIALRESFTSIYRVSLSSGKIDIMHASADTVCPENKPVRLDGFIEDIAKKYIRAEEREEFVGELCLDGVKSRLDEKSEFYREYRFLSGGGEYKWLSINVKLINTDSGEKYAYCFVKNIDEKKKSEELSMKYKMLEQQMQYQKQLQISDSRYEIIVRQTGAAVFEWNRETDTVFASDALPKRFKDNFIAQRSLRAALPSENIHPKDVAQCAFFLECIERGQPQTEVSLRLRNDDDEFVWYKISVTSMFDADGALERVVGTVMDVNESKSNYEILKYRAEYDSLTGAPNIDKFYADGQHIVDNMESMGGKYAVLRMDIDKFKFINDVYGRTEGDRVLQYLSFTLNTLCTGENIFARMSGDVFVLLVKYEYDEELEGLVREISERMATYPLEHKLKLAFGICKVENADVPINTLCDWANLAQKKIKGSMMHNYAFYDDTLRNEILEEKIIEDEMRSALAGGQFKLYLQPKYDIETAEVIGAESLVRWIHPHKGMISPNTFIPLFEKNGFIIKLDEYIWEQTCIVLRKWLERGLRSIPISINISRVHINNPQLCNTLIDLVEKYGIPPRLLELEITESAFLDDLGELYSSLKKLQDFGFSLAMDDFGSGYSSLNMLKNVPLDIIKIDREFLNDTVVTERGKTVIRHTIAMAKQLNMKVVAEGVETIDQAAFLLESGCSIAQGFYYSKPVCKDEFETLAFGVHGERAVEPEINRVLSQNQDIVSIMLSVDKKSARPELFEGSTITAAEMCDLKRAFVSVINKYRLAMQKSNTSLMEVDFKTNTVLSTLRADSAVTDREFSTFEDICDYILTNAKPQYTAALENYLDINYIVDRILNYHKDIKTEFELVEKGRSIWYVLNVIPITKDRQLERLILAFTDITAAKTLEGLQKE